MKTRVSARRSAQLGPRLSLAVAGLALLVVAGLWLWLAAGPPEAAPEAAPETGAETAVPSVPSGQPVALLDRSEEADGVLRFRFLAPQIGADSAGEQASEDMQALCDLYALAHLPDPARPPRQIVISLSERALPLGEINPDVVQFFEAYRIEAGACVWEMF